MSEGLGCYWVTIRVRIKIGFWIKNEDKITRIKDTVYILYNDMLIWILSWLSFLTPGDYVLNLNPSFFSSLLLPRD